MVGYGMWRYVHRTVSVTTFSDAVSGLNFTVPTNTEVNTSVDQNSTHNLIKVSSEVVDDKTATGQILTADATALAQGVIDQVPDHAASGSLQVIPVTGGYVKSFVSLGDGSECGVQFVRTVLYYRGSMQYKAEFTGNTKAIIASSPNYFTANATCASGYAWNWEMDTHAPDGFYELVAEKGGQGMAQEWYDASQAFVNSISFK